MEKVNHPNHYNIPGKKECIVQMQEDFGECITAIFCLTNAYKYLYRAGAKQGETAQDDIKKAQWYYDYMDNNLKYNFDEWMFKNFKALYAEVKHGLKKQTL